MSYQIPSAQLRRLTHLHPKMNNESRCSSNYEILNRFLEIKHFPSLLNTDEIDDLLLSSSENDMLQRICLRLKELNEVTVDLQKDDTTFPKV